MHSDTNAIHAHHLPPSSDLVHAPVLTAVLHPDPLTAFDIAGIFGQFDNRHSLTDPNERTAIEVAADASLDLVLFEQARHDRSGSPLGRTDHLRLTRAKVQKLTADLDRHPTERAPWAPDLAALLVRIDSHLTRAIALAATETSRRPSQDRTAPRSVRPSRRRRWPARRILAAQRISATTTARALARAEHVAASTTAHPHLPHASDLAPTLVTCSNPAAAPGSPNAPPHGLRAIAA
jgi:hypothetical protein